MWVSSLPECLVSECPLFPRRIRGAIGRLPLFHQARVKLFENVNYSQGEKGDPPCEGPATDLRGTCEGTDSGEER